MADKAYNKLVIPFLGKLDDGNVFRNIIVRLIQLLSYIVLIGGVVYSIFEMFGDRHFIDKHIINGASGGAIFGAVIGLLIGFILSLICVWFLYSVLKKRSSQIAELEYGGLLKYVFIALSPKIILLIGELIFITVLYAGVLQICAALIGSYVYAPLSTLPQFIFMELPGIDALGSMMSAEIYGNYDNFAKFLKIGVIGIVSAFIALIYFYILKEVYNYILKLILNLIKFLPRFAIPLSIRNRDNN